MCLPALQQFPLGGIWWASTGHGEKKYCSSWCTICGGKYAWRALNRILVVQLGTNANEAKVFKAHAAPLGCVTI